MLKIIKITNSVLAAGFLLCMTYDSYAIGKFSLGINTGATYDPNNLENEINSYNKEIEYQKETVSGTKGKQMNVPYGFVLGANIKYQFNYLLFRLGGHYAKPIMDSKGNFTPAAGAYAGQKNSIRISTYQASFPLSIGFLLPVKEMTYFYLGGGVTFHTASVKITQSNPAAGPFSGSGRRNSYTANFPGWHLIFGAEVPIYEKYSITVEWIHQEGRSYPIKNDGLDDTGNKINTPKKTINARGDFIFFGINYYISI